MSEQPNYYELFPEGGPHRVVLAKDLVTEDELRQACAKSGGTFEPLPESGDWLIMCATETELFNNGIAVGELLKLRHHGK